GMLYESYIHPLTILSGLPSAALGALVMLWLFGSELNVYSFVGLILLIGLVEKNAIMQIDFALEAERKRGLGPVEAIYEGCLIRFRPIMMTRLAALLGSLPIALGLGAGGESRRPLGLAVVGGLVVSQIITLYLTPVVYTYIGGTAQGPQDSGSVKDPRGRESTLEAEGERSPCQRAGVGPPRPRVYARGRGTAKSVPASGGGAPRG
ncbi:MAG: hypothetical protein DMF92_17035, partial [Acidobacteria bacterium]